MRWMRGWGARGPRGALADKGLLDQPLIQEDYPRIFPLIQPLSLFRIEGIVAHYEGGNLVFTTLFGVLSAPRPSR